MRATADELMSFAGGAAGRMIGGPAGAIIGAEVGAELAPLVDETAHKIVRRKRKVSKYQRTFGKELKKLKKLHPRTRVQKLMKRAHLLTRRALK